MMWRRRARLGNCMFLCAAAGHRSLPAHAPQRCVRAHKVLALASIFMLAGLAATPATTPPPATQAHASIPGSSGERLRYSVNWPSGLGLGELDISASRSSGDSGKAAKLTVDATLDASLPGYPISDQYKSEGTGDYCSTSFEKNFKHGTRSNNEVTTFDLKNNTLTRETKNNGGGKSDVSTGACAKDALMFIYFLRNELAHGRLPHEQQVFFGAAYNVRLDFSGTQKMKIGGALTDVDRITANVHGPSSDVTVEIFFAHDTARTPELVRVPVSLGTFSAELMK